MGNQPRIESKDYSAFTTTRTKHSELWFINNKAFETHILALTAKYSEVRNVKLYALAIEGSHIHILADYPDENCSDFQRDLNSMIARSAPHFCFEFHDYGLWERRYSKELIPQHRDDILSKFFYTVLQPVQDGLVERISEYPGYNCCSDAIRGIKREFKIVDRTAYNRARRGKKHVNIKDYTTIHTLKFNKIPGYEDLSHKDYVRLLLKKVEERQSELIRIRHEEGKGFVGREELLKTKPGTRAKNPKVSTRYSFRPRVSSVCPERRKLVKDFYWNCQDCFKRASAKYRKGFLDTVFPHGMYRPHLSSKINGPPVLMA